MSGPASAGPGYTLVRALTRFLLRLFYARIETLGTGHVPSTGPLILAANHHNSIVDAMLVLAVLDRPVRILANAPLFRHPLIGPFLRLIGALPVHRRQEAGSDADPDRNAALFDATTAALHAGGAILIFPEGRTQPEPVLLELRTGAARMLLAAEKGASGNPPVTLLPVGLVFDRPGTFREGRALVFIGSPIATSDTVEDGSARAARVLTERLTAALRAQIIEADDRRTLRLLHLVEELWREGSGAPAPDAAARVARLQMAMRVYRDLLEEKLEPVAEFRAELEKFDAECEGAGLTAQHLSRSYSAGSVLRFVLREGFALLVGAPLALCGLLLHGIPYQLTALAVKLVPHTDEEEATDKIAAGLLLYPLAWLSEAWAAFALGGRWALLGFLAALLPTGFFALSWRERFENVRREARAFARFLGDRDLPRRLRERRAELALDIAALAGAHNSFDSVHGRPE
jgi:glycerol-3-phosphate O-acyltransferase/dihydroxyacetone phosphate acyltransferase